MEVLKWEEGKRWQKKVDSLKAKLSDKAKELEAAQKQITSLKEIISRQVIVHIFLNGSVSVFFFFFLPPELIVRRVSLMGN